MRSAVVSASLVLAAAIAQAQGTPTVVDDLSEARRLEAALDYQGALAVVDRAIARGHADPGRLVELHLLAGKLAAGLDRPSVAEAHYARVLALRPDATLPAGTSPKLTAPFDAARARTSALHVSVTAVQGLVTLATSGDALGLVAGIQLHVVDAAGQHRDLVDRAATRIAIPAGSTATEVAALDTAGNRVWIGSVPASAPLASSAILAPPPAATAHAAHGVLARASTWAVISGLALGTGAFAGWRFSVAQHDWDALHAAGADFTTLRQREVTGRRWGTTANLAFGVGAATGIAALILYLRHDDEVVVTPGPGAGVAINARF